MIITWALVFSICIGGTCDDYVMGHYETPRQCLENTVKYIEDLDSNLQHAISCEETYITEGDIDAE